MYDMLTEQEPPQLRNALNLAQPGTATPSMQVMRKPEQQTQHACPCGGGCPRCSAQAGRLEAAPVASAQEHERRADEVADHAIRGADAHADASAAHTHGDQMPFGLRQHFEARLGHDLSGVRIRADKEAAAAAEGLGATAFTKGNEINFGQGEYAPHTESGRRLLAHELSHVVQQGAAPRVAASEHAPVSFTGHAPRVQLQEVKTVGGNWFDRPDAVKKLIKDNDNTQGKEISKALEKNDLKGTPSPFRTEVIDGKTHEWRISVRAEWLDRASLNPGTKYGVTKDTVRYTQTGKPSDIEVHEIPIEVNKLLKSSAEDEKLFPKGTKAQDEARVNFMAARTIYHEMIHALIRIDEESESSPQTQATAGLAKKTTKLKNSPKLAAIEKAVMQSVSNVVFATEKITNRGDLFAKPGETSKTRAEIVHDEAVKDQLDPKFIPNLDKAAQSLPFANKSPAHFNFLEETVRMLVEEKHARQTTADAFKLTDYKDNSKLVDDYVGQVENTVTELARKQTGRPALMLAGNKDYDRELSGLHDNVFKMYNLLDTEPDDPPSSVGPKMFQTPETLPAPLDMSGNPIKEK